jgi:hypothetical protein
MAAVVINVDPHKGSHTAEAIDQAEAVLGQVRVRACAAQVERLLGCSADWPQRTWAVEGAGGVGHLLAQQLIAAGERVLDVQPMLGARVRLLATGATNKNDPNDALSVGIAALRSHAATQVRPDDDAAVLKIRAKRHRGRLNTLAPLPGSHGRQSKRMIFRHRTCGRLFTPRGGEAIEESSRPSYLLNPASQYGFSWSPRPPGCGPPSHPGPNRSRDRPARTPAAATSSGKIRASARPGRSFILARRTLFPNAGRNSLRVCSGTLMGY